MGISADTPGTEGTTPSGVGDGSSSASWNYTFVGLSLVAVLSLGPLLLEPKPIQFVAPHSIAAVRWAAKGIVVALMILAIVVANRAPRTSDRERGGRIGLRNLALALLAGLMTLWHLFAVDTRRTEVRPDVHVWEWQRDLYLHILNGKAQDVVSAPLAPHGYRPLPYGFTRSLELFTGDWLFSCVAYRWFFTFWLLWGCYQFVGVFHDRTRSWLAVAIVGILYPLSVQFYWGQLTDPLSHALFVLGLICIVQDRWLELAAALALGVMAKETAVLLVPAYGACYLLRGGPTLARTALLGSIAIVACLAVRLPLGWTSDLKSVNGTTGLMIGTNLGIGKPLYRTQVPLYQSYLHPLLFVGVFVPVLALRWRGIDSRLRALILTLTPLLLASSLCFSWLYESRNYMPLLPVLAAAAFPPLGRRNHSPATSTNATTANAARLTPFPQR